MSAPPPSPPPGAADKQEPASESGKGGHKHFYRAQEKEEQSVRIKLSLIDQIAVSISSIQQAFSGAGRASAAAKPSMSDIGGKIKGNTKYIVIGAAALVVLFLAVVVLPHLPAQMKRTAGFSAFDRQDYLSATASLREYLEDRPTDYAAQYVAAQAALYSGDADYARTIIDDLYSGGKLPDSGVGYHYALLHYDDPDTALDALNKLLQAAPDHAGGRLLHGLLVAERKDAVREAREDFLRLLEILGSEDHYVELQFLHSYFQENGYLSLQPAFPAYSGRSYSSLERYIGFNPKLDGFVYLLQPGSDEQLRGEELQGEDIANLYFAYMLMREEEIEEAQSVLTGLERNAPDSLSVRQMAAFLSFYAGDYAGARDQLEALSEALPEDAKVLNNLVLAEVLRRSSQYLDIQRIAALYGNLLNMQASPEIYSNGAYFLMLNEQYDEAAQLLGKIGDDSMTPQGRLTRGLLSFLAGDVGAAVADLSLIKTTAKAGRYLFAIYERSGRIDDAIDLLEDMQREDGDNHEIVIEKINALKNNQEWRLAFLEMRKFLQENPDSPENREARYLLGSLALALGEVAMTERQQEELLPLREEGNIDQHYVDALDASIYLWQGDVPTAASYYFLAFSNAPRTRHKYEYLIDWAKVWGDVRPLEVETVLRRHLLDYKSAKLQSLLAYVLADTNAREAATYADEATRVGKGFLIDLYAGAALTKIGIYARAVPLLEAAVRYRPTDRKALLFLRDAYAGAGDAESAERVGNSLSYLEAVVHNEGPVEKASYKLYLPNYKSIINKVRIALAAGAGGAGYGEAVAAYEAELANDENEDRRAELLYSRATFEAYSQKYETALGFFEQALALGLKEKQRQIGAMLFYAEILSLLQRYDESAAVIQQIMALDGRQLLYRRLYALELADAGKKEEAVKQLSALLEEYPADINTYQELATLQASLGDIQAAIALMRKLLLVAPNYAPAYSVLSELYRSQEDERNARRYLEIYNHLQE